MHFHIVEESRRPSHQAVVTDTCAVEPEAALARFDEQAWMLAGTGWVAGCYTGERGGRWLIEPGGRERRFRLESAKQHAMPGVNLLGRLLAGLRS